MAITQQSRVITEVRDQLTFATQHSKVDEPNLANDHLRNISNIIENYFTAKAKE